MRHLRSPPRSRQAPLGIGKLEVRVACQHRRLQQQPHRGAFAQLRPAVPLADLAPGLVALARDCEKLTVRPDVAGGHLVLRQGTGLVRADRGGASQGLHGGELADEGVADDHLAHSQREADGDDGGQALGHGGDGEADRGHEHLEDVAALQDTHEEHDGTDSQRRDAEDLPHLRELLLQRRVLGHLLLDHRRDEPDLRVHPRVGDDASAPAEGGQRAHVGHGEPVPERGFLLQGGGGILLHRHRLAREGSLLDAEVHRLDEPHVGGHVVARLEQDAVAGHELAGGDGQGLPSPQHPRLGGGHLLERRQRLLGLRFLDHADHGVEDDDEDDRTRVDVLAKDDGYHRCHHQDDDEKVLELPEKQREEGRPGLLLQLVCPLRGQAPRSLLHGKAARGVHLQGGGRRGGGKGMPGRADRRCRRVTAGGFFMSRRSC